MAKINILDSSVYNRIAAGEVVERPASVVKEFVENSIDAGARQIEIRVERGGKDLISVSDDGCGIERSELHAAFLPHATSKIASADDLEKIGTLGFRGEALASVASVANVTLRSKAAGAEEAFSISCSGGKTGEIVPCALGEGTEIVAEDLFFNTPARAKFMKTDKGEESEVFSVVARFILGNPQIAFRYYADGKPVLRSFGGGEEEAIAAVYGAAAVEECYRLDAHKNGVHIYGYLGKPAYTKANRTYQTTFVNGRCVWNNTVSSAVSNAYGGYLMKRQYPFYVLFIDVPPEIVDVNVHPNKSDVRFENNQVIYGSVYSVISAVLDGNASALEYVVKAPSPAAGQEEPSVGQANAAPSPAVFEKEKDAPRVPFPEARSYPVPPPAAREGAFISFHDSGTARPPAPEKRGNKEEVSDIFAENKRYLEQLDKKAKQQKIVLENARYCGSLFNTYLLYEEGDGVYIIDQHAAHERLIFDRLRAEMQARKVVRQPMLVPYIVQVNREEGQFLAENLSKIAEIGFDIEEFGEGNFKISSVPLDLQDIDLKSFFDELLGEVGSLRGIRLSELLRDKIAMTACKHAVKGGMMLTDAEKQKLFDMLHGDMGLKCPHGRPVAVRLGKTEIEKMFKRIV